MWTSLMFFLEGEEPWKDLVNRLSRPRKDDYFRFNLLIPDGTPSLNDLTAIDRLSAVLRTITEGGTGLNDALSTLLVSCFYFELNELPIRQSQLYLVRGRIKCRSTQPRHIIRTFNRMHLQIRIRSREHDLGVCLTEDDVCTACLR